MSTHGDVENTRSTQNQYSRIPRTFATRAAFGILALTLAAGLSPIPNVLAQTTTDSVTDQFDEPRRLSILGALGISLIEEVKVTAIALNEDATEVTVTLSRADNMTTGTPLDGDNQTDTTTTANPAVTVAAFRTQLDLASLIQAHMGKGHEMSTYSGQSFGQGDIMTQNQDHMGMTGRNVSGDMPMFDIMSFIESLEIGSNVEEEGWTSPTELTIPVISGEEGTNAMQDTTAALGPNDNSNTEVVVVVVIPYTREAITAGQPIDQQLSMNQTED